MSVDFSGFTEMRKRIEALTDDMPKIMEQLVVGEGVYAVGQARRICKEDGRQQRYLPYEFSCRRQSPVTWSQ